MARNGIGKSEGRKERVKKEGWKKRKKVRKERKERTDASKSVLTNRTDVSKIPLPKGTNVINHHTTGRRNISFAKP